MDSDEAGSILAEQLASYRALTYPELAERVDTVEIAELRAPSGVEYQLEVQFCWDSKPNGDVRVIGSIDDGGWRTFAPLSDDFIRAPNGTFVDE